MDKYEYYGVEGYRERATDNLITELNEDWADNPYYHQLQTEFEPTVPYVPEMSDQTGTGPSGTESTTPWYSALFGSTRETQRRNGSPPLLLQTEEEEQPKEAEPFRPAWNNGPWREDFVPRELPGMQEPKSSNEILQEGQQLHQQHTEPGSDPASQELESRPLHGSILPCKKRKLPPSNRPSDREETKRCCTTWSSDSEGDELPSDHGSDPDSQAEELSESSDVGSEPDTDNNWPERDREDEPGFGPSPPSPVYQAPWYRHSQYSQAMGEAKAIIIDEKTQ